MAFFDKSVFRRGRIKKPTPGLLTDLEWLKNTEFVYSVLAWLVFVIVCVPVLGYEWIKQSDFGRLAATAVVVVLICLAAALYISQYQKRLIKNPARVFGLVALFIALLIATKITVELTEQTFWATAAAVASAVAAALILAIAYSQRFATAMILLYCTLAYLATTRFANINVLLIMSAAALPFCFFLKDIRTRMKLLEVSFVAAVTVFITTTAIEYLSRSASTKNVLQAAGANAGITMVVGVLIQGLLPVIEKVFRIATSMTLLDYSDVNQPLLKRLAIEAPGTFSHSLFIGSIAEAAADAIGRNGLLCRVGAYYHDVGKINKPGYFVENQLGTLSWHKELSPQMSQLIIVGHVKDGMELAEEYGLPMVLPSS